MSNGDARLQNLSLLQKTKALIELEKSLTTTLERVEPWLQKNSKRQIPNRPRVRPVPSTMDEAERILALARVLASRTSAPAGWNSQAPVAGFSTPNPLPHQLRGGALAALQLERARKSERELRQQQQDEATKRAKAKDEETKASSHAQLQQQQQGFAAPARSQQERRQQPHRQTSVPKTQVDVSMNLSDSSSEDEED